MKYEFGSLDELAYFFRVKAEEITQEVDRKEFTASKKELHGMKIEAMAWLMAAEIVKDTVIIGVENGN